MQPTQRLGQWPRSVWAIGRRTWRPRRRAAKGKEQKKTKRAPPRDLLPADAGLVLNSTLVGSGRRMALIGGEPYWEGDVVLASHGSESFRLIEIFARQVVLERAGKHYSLEIKTTSHDGAVVAESDRPRPRKSPQTGTTRPKTSMPNRGKPACQSR